MRRNLRQEKQRCIRRKKYKQRGGFLNRYDFAYTGQDTVNQAFKNLDKSAPPLLKNLSGEVNKVLEQRINLITRQGGAELKQIGPKLLKGAVKDAYKTLYFGKTTFSTSFGKNSMTKA